MKFSSAFVLSLFFHVINAKVSSRIAFGVDTSISNYPCYCRLWTRKTDGNTYFCGGSLIADDQILTAAHCFTDAESVNVCCGSSSCETDEGTCYLDRQASGVRIHKDYLQALRTDELYGDIAYLKVPTGSFDSAMIRPCRILTDSSVNFEGEDVTVVGCGQDENDRSYSNMKKAFQVVIPFEEGIRYYGLSNRYRVIFTQDSERSSACRGDSGGGLFHGNSMDLVGLVSFGSSSCTEGAPVAFTLIQEYMDFVEKGRNGLSAVEFSRGKAKFKKEESDVVDVD